LARKPDSHVNQSELQLERLIPAPLPQATLDATQRIACLRLIRSENIGPVTFRELINLYGGATAALDALPSLAKRGGRTLRICPRDRAEAELDAADALGMESVFTVEPGYPPTLAHIEQPPPMLYVRGRNDLLHRPAVAIVGSRDASSAGLAITRTFASGLGASGFMIVSGLARGIDSVAHDASLDSGTIAVVAGGADVVYPPENAALMADIATRGCIVSEMPPGFQPRGQDFPRRNRIISGIGLGVLVIEAARRSGTLITARMAGEQGRDVFAVPGHPLDPRAEGTNHLLKQGAILVTAVDDILEHLRPQLSSWPAGAPGSLAIEEARQPSLAPPPKPLPPPEPAGHEHAAVLATIGPAPVALDQIVRTTGLPARTVQAVLLELALAGRIERHAGQLISIKS
jgi:DNA processing protein